MAGPVFAPGLAHRKSGLRRFFFVCTGVSAQSIRNETPVMKSVSPFFKPGPGLLS